MSSREQFLLKLLVVMAILTGLFLGYKRFYIPRYKEAEQKLNLAEQRILTAESVLKSADLYAEEQQWLSETEPEPTTQQAAQTELQAFCERLAQDSQLTIKSQTALPSVQEEGAFYHRARMDFLLSGMETNFYRWISSLNDPSQFRRVTYMRLNPLRDDDTQIEAKVVIEQWFTPETL